MFAHSFVPMGQRRELRHDGLSSPVVVRAAQSAAHGVIRDRSHSGLSLALDQGLTPRTGQTLELAVADEPRIVCRVVRLASLPSGGWLVGCRRLAGMPNQAQRPPRLRHWLRASVR